MDPPEPHEGGGGGGEGKERSLAKILFRCGFSIVFSVVGCFLVSFLFGIVAIAIASFSSSSQVSVPGLCRILSSSVDIKSSKVCELGLLNYKSKNVLYPLKKGKTKFRCHDDYYWASVFEVEYKEKISGQTLHAVSEAPKEALPHDCRPSFGTALLTKMKFKVNETYDCRFTLGSHKADIYPDNLFNCQAIDPSTTEMLRRFFILFMRSSFFDKDGPGLKMVAYGISGIVSGVLFATLCMIIIRSLQISMLFLSRRWDARKYQLRLPLVRFRRVCLLVAYFSAVGWLMLQYGRMIGLKQLSLGSNLGERAM